MSKVAVIGGAGFIGSHIVEELVKQGKKVVVLDNFTSGSLKNIDTTNKNIEFELVDIRDGVNVFASIFKEYDIEEVYHLAAEPYIPECYERPEEFFDVNAVGTMNVLLACKKAGVKKILYWSSSEVYGTGSGSMDESYPLNPQSTYAVSKLAGDRLAFTLHKEQGIPVVILRQFNVYGKRETHEYVIPEIISQLSKGDTLNLGNIEAKRDFIYAEDAAKMAVELMEKGEVGEVYNLGSGNTYSIREIALTIAEIMGREPTIKIDESRLRPHDVNYLKSDNTKVYSIIKGRPQTSLKEGLKKTIDWFFENGGEWGWENKDD